MAQPVYDDHPLGQYLREAGESTGLMAGGLADLLGIIDEDEDISLDELEEMETLENILNDFLESLTSTFSTQSFVAFVERFKYNVISSSLLSASLTTHPIQRASSSYIPGNLHTRSHSRASSVDSEETDQQQQQPSHSLTTDSQYFTLSAAAALLTFLFGSGHYFTSLSLGAFLLYIFTKDTSSTVMTPALDTLNDLISAGNVWDSVVQEVMTTLEKDEKRMTYTSSTPTSPRSSLRVALHSALLTTQNQCDNVRQLLSALTSQNELSQLSYMYAPPSPVPTRTSLLSNVVSPASRPFSLPSRRRTISNPNLNFTSAAEKRSTWNGSYASLANAGSPTKQILLRREKRRSDLSVLLAPTLKSSSAPNTPVPELEGVAEEQGDESLDHTDQESEVSTDDFDAGETFGLQALQLQRNQKRGGLKVLNSPPSLHRRRSLMSYSTAATPGNKSPLSPTRSILGGPSSRFTSSHTPRHPLSMTALHHALKGAISSKRHACSHLLALRFEEEKDDETYWEDVRSVMELLTTTLADASSRLTEALEDVERMRLRDEMPSPVPGGSFELTPEKKERKVSASSSSLHVGFAPMPSYVARFAAHVDAISGALSDAREQLEECVAGLKEDTEIRGVVPSPVRAHSRKESEPRSGEDCEQEQQHPAIQAYERLRRELGYALRECERGRERLLDVINPHRMEQPLEEDDQVPGLAHEGASESSDDKPDSMNEHRLSTEMEPKVTVVNADAPALDDATPHLLFTSTTDHLPPPGIEQVYEGDSGDVGSFKREKSKLTREERIQMVRKARESGKRLSDLGIHLPSFQDTHNESSPKMEKWGPGGEVVQELKDVIWKVGERRRKMTDSHGGPPIIRAGEVG